MQLVAQGNDIPTMLGSAVLSTKASVEAIGRDRLRPGDVIISNDAYLGGGNHQPDVQFTRPVFFGETLVAFVMTRGHWTDIGGQAPGSYSINTWDIYGEGVRIPPVLLYRGDEIVADVQSLIVNNTRDPEGRLLDIQAQYAGCFVGDQRIKRWPPSTAPPTCATPCGDRSTIPKRLMREAIGAIPDGVYEAEDFIEGVHAPGWRGRAGAGARQGHGARQRHPFRLHRQRTADARRHQLHAGGDLQQHLVHREGDHRRLHSDQPGLLPAGHHPCAGRQHRELHVPGFGRERQHRDLATRDRPAAARRCRRPCRKA